MKTGTHTQVPVHDYFPMTILVAGYDFEDKLEERIVLSGGYHACPLYG